MKLALISPKGACLSRRPEIEKFWRTTPALNVYRKNYSGISTGLLIVAALTPEHYDIEIIDENIEEIDFSRHYDLVGISAMTQQSVRAYEIADRFRERAVKVVFGGIHATVLPEEAKKHSDSVVIGEAEYLWPELLNDLENHQLKPFYKTDRIVDLKDSPMPRYDLLKPESYKSIYLQTSRGCPRDCEFCAASNVYGYKFRYKSVDQVISEIRYIKDNLPDIRRFQFGDDNIFSNKKYAKEMLEKMTEMDITWLGQTDIGIARDDNLLSMIRKSGCVQVLIGLESLSEDNLEKLDNGSWKQKQIKNYSKYVQKIQSKGIAVFGAFVIGFDHDNKNTFQNIKAFINKNCRAGGQVTILTPLPGTRLREKMIKEDRLLPTNWDNYTLADVNFIHPTLTKEELEEGWLDIYKGISTNEMYLKRMEFYFESHDQMAG